MKNRYFQFVRGILIFLVIFIHCMYENEISKLNYVNIVIRCCVNFCVAVFIFLSGYFVNKKKIQEDYKKYIVSRFKRLIIPLIIFSFLYTIIGVLKENWNLREAVLRFITFKSEAHLYYIVVLFQLVILTPGIFKLLENKKIKTILYTITPIYLIVLGILRIFVNIQIPFYQFLFCGWIIYYILGIEHERIKVKPNYGFVLGFLLISIIGNIYIYIKNPSLYPYVTSQLNILNMFYVLGIIPIILEQNSKYTSSKISRIIEKIGDNSFGIYFIHLIVLKVLRIFFRAFKFNFIIYYLIMSVIAVFVSYILIKIFKNITKNKFDKFLGF